MDDDLKLYKKQINFVSHLYKKQRKQFFNQMDIKNFTDNKKFLENINPFFSNKGPKNNKITIVEGQKIISEDQEVAEALSDFFNNAVKNLGTDKKNTGKEQFVNGIEDPLEAAIHKFGNHPSILKINEMVKNKDIEPLNFTQISTEYMEKEIMKLNVKKATTYKKYPT